MLAGTGPGCEGMLAGTGPGRGGMLAGLLPAAVAVAEWSGTLAGPGAAFLAGREVAASGPGAAFLAGQEAVAATGLGAALFPDEEAAIRTAGARRRAEFAAGRRCAREALAALGLPGVPILPGRAGEPVWPDGVTGSITHCAGYVGCAVARVGGVARASDVAGIGIDAEPDAALPPGLIESVAGSAELAWIVRAAREAPMVCWDRLLFSAKEATGKLWYPQTGQWPEFSQVTVFPAADGTFAARLEGRAAIQGRWLARDGLIVTGLSFGLG